MSAYTRELYDLDKAALDAAQTELNRLVAGEGDGRLALFEQDFHRISGYFKIEDGRGIEKQISCGLILRMFTRMMNSKSITGFQCQEYKVLLDWCIKKCKSMRVFKRRAKIKCFSPRVHQQPCFCARLAAVEAVAGIQDDAVKAEAAAKVEGILALEASI